MDEYPDVAPVADDTVAPEAAPEVETAEVPADDATPDAEPTEAAAEEAAPRKARGDLELAVKAVTDEYATGALVLPEGEFLTPHRIGKEIAKTGYSPSTGAVAACLQRWFDVGYIVVNEKPFAFTDYTDAAVEKGLAELKAEAKARKSAAKAAASAPAEVTPEPEPEPEVAPEPEPEPTF